MCDLRHGRDLVQNCRYEYNGFNQATKVKVEYFDNKRETPTTVQTQENFYDAENFRYGIMEDGERTNFVTNGWKVVSEQDSSFNTTNRIVLGYGIIASDDLENGEDAYRYFHWNEHGDTEYITSADGQILNRYEYDAFGSLTTADEIIRNRYTYNGEQYDAITSQYYLRARFYNPQVARFTQEDVYRGDGLNLYAYCANNPVMYVNPSGYAHCPDPTEPEGMKKLLEDNAKNNNGTEGNEGGSDIVLALPAPTTSNPWMNETDITSRQAPKDFYINMAMSPNQTKPGGWGTVDTIPDVNYVRNDLAVTPEFKGEGQISDVQRYFVPEGTWIQEGTVGPQTYNDITYQGGGSQVQILNYSDRSKLVPVGEKAPIK